MSEEIIIDGVNVAECPHRKKEVTFMNVIKCYNYGACEGVNCLYKQLKRLQAENEELKKIIKTQNPWHNCKNCNKDYKQALEEIRDMCNNTCEKNKDCSNSCYECKSIDEPVAINRILNKINEVLK